MYRELIERVQQRLDELGFEPFWQKMGKPVKASRLVRVSKHIGVEFPPDLADFYLEVGDGAVFTWDEDNAAEKASVGFELLDLQRLVDSVESGKKHGRAWNYEFDPQRELSRLSQQWLPILPEGDGDKLCVDTGALGSPIVYYQHDWCTERHGWKLAPNFKEFFTAWADMCFQHPDWWNDALCAVGVDWNGPQFNQSITLKR